MIRKSSAALIAVLLAGCGGGGGSDDTAVSANPPAATPAPATSPPPVAAVPTPSAPPIAAPTPVQTPVPGSPGQIPEAPPTTPIPVVPGVPDPVTPPVDSTPPPPTASPLPSPSPQPRAEETFVLGRIVRAALERPGPGDHPQGIGGQFFARKADPATGRVDPAGDRVSVTLVYGNERYFYQDVFSFKDQNFLNTRVFFYPSTSSGQFEFSAAARASVGCCIDQPLNRAAPFVINDDAKFLLNTTVAEWRGTSTASHYFLQLQIASYAPSNTVFKICLHKNLPNIRRLTCTLHSKDTGEFRGAQLVDDSRSTGPVEYLPVVE